jgi:dipeptide/tripeptide permease
MKWLFFLLSLLALFAANNALFWLPGHYDWFNFVAAGVAIGLAVLFAWLSSRRFATSASTTRPTWKDLAKAPPATICIFVLLLFLAVGLMELVAYADR